MAGLRHNSHEEDYKLPPHSSLLQSIQRQDGLWESIEQDEEMVIDISDDEKPPQKEEIQNSPGAQRPNLVCLDDPHDVDVKAVGRKSIGTQTLTEVVPVTTAATGVSPATPDHPTNSRAVTPTRADLIARILHCPLPHRDFSPMVMAAAADPPSSPAGAASTTTTTNNNNNNNNNTGTTATTPSGTGRRRGRPKKSGPVRRVRFSDPISPEAEPQLRSRDSHVFVRLLKVTVHVPAEPPGPLSGQVVEFVWNNRAKGWKAAGDQVDEGLVELHWLFDYQAGRLLMVRPFVSPTEGGGVRQSVEMMWDAAKYCFQGVNEDSEIISITLGEMRDMARDPWGRQYVGYVMSQV